MTKKECNIILFSVTLCWASSYIFIKNLPADFSSFAYLALTSGIAGIITAVIFHRSLRKLNRKSLLQGAVIALLISGVSVCERLGLESIPSSTASAMSTLSIVFVPIILLLFRQPPSRNNVAGIAIILAGLVVSQGGQLQSGSLPGMLFMLGSCLFMSVYLVLAARFAKETDPPLLTTLQLLLCAVFGAVAWFFEDPQAFGKIAWTREMLSSIFVLAFFSKGYAYIMLMYGEKHADAISVTVISALEPVATLILALVIPSASGATEVFSAHALAGAIVIAAGAVVAGSDFLSPKKPVEVSADAPPEAVPEHADAGSGAADEAASNKTISGRLGQFLLTMVPFAVLGAAFKVMVLVEGFTEVRPANAIPVIAGLGFGWVGGLGCAVGNLIADCFGTLNMTSLLGLLGNFMAAYVSFRMWYAISARRPNVHSWKGLALYAWVSLVSALSCAWILGFGLEAFFGAWVDTVYEYVLLNNFGFALALGLPIFILFTSGDFKVQGRRPQSWENPLKLRGGAWTVVWLVACTAVLIAIAAGAVHGLHLANSVAMQGLSVAAVVLVAGSCLLPPKGQPTEDAGKKEG